MIACFKCLEDYFLNDPTDFNKCEFFQDELLKFYNDLPEFYQDSNNQYQQDINLILDNFIEKEEKEYVNIKELLNDSLTLIYLRTYRSLISNFDDFTKVNDDINTAIDLSKGLYYKSILNSSSNLKLDLVLAKKVKN